MMHAEQHPEQHAEKHAAKHREQLAEHNAARHPQQHPDLPSIASVAAMHSDLPGLAALLDRAKLAELFTPLVGADMAATARVARMRVKPGTSITAAVSVESAFTFLPTSGPSEELTPARTWWRVRALAEKNWEVKGVKEVARAQRRHLPALAHAELLTTVVSHEADRELEYLYQLRPDSGTPIHLDEELGAGLPTAVWTRTLSYNPDRRWVGAVHDVDGTPVALLRWHADHKRPLRLPWTPGKAWGATDAEARGAALAQAVARDLAQRQAETGNTASLQPQDLRLQEVADFLTALHRPWGKRAHRLLDEMLPALAELPLVPAHGDLTPDQVVIQDGHIAILDWDRLGLFPQGWDSATWTVGEMLTPGVDCAAHDGFSRHPVPAATAAAAFLIYSPDPFRRQFQGWPELTARMLDAAADAWENR